MTPPPVMRPPPDYSALKKRLLELIEYRPYFVWKHGDIAVTAECLVPIEEFCTTGSLNKPSSPLRPVPTGRVAVHEDEFRLLTRDAVIEITQLLGGQLPETWLWVEHQLKGFALRIRKTDIYLAADPVTYTYNKWGEFVEKTGYGRHWLHPGSGLDESMRHIAGKDYTPRKVENFQENNVDFSQVNIEWWTKSQGGNFRDILLYE